MTGAMPRYEIYQDESNEGEEGRWRWRLKAANGEIVASGEGYTSARDAKRGFEDAKRNFMNALEARS
jgi:uncharacterized protein YegP (UPF0339 family)